MSRNRLIKAVEINEELHARLQRVTDETGISFSEIARRALVAYLEKEEAKLAALAEVGL